MVAYIIFLTSESISTFCQLRLIRSELLNRTFIKFVTYGEKNQQASGVFTKKSYGSGRRHKRYFEYAYPSQHNWFLPEIQSIERYSGFSLKLQRVSRKFFLRQLLHVKQ